MAVVTIPLFNDTQATQFAFRSIAESVREQQRGIRNLSSGRRINTASDDAAGFAISQEMRTQIRGLDRASRNVQEAVTMLTIAERAMMEIMNLAREIRELVVDSTNDTHTMESRRNIQLHVNHNLTTIDQIRNRATFNSHQLIDGTWGRYRHTWNQSTYIPGMPAIPGRPSHTYPIFGNANMSIWFLPNTPMGENVFQIISDSNLNTDFVISPGFDDFDLRFYSLMEVNRSLGRLVGLSPTHSFMTWPNTSNVTDFNNAVNAWLADRGIAGEISNFQELHNDWQLLTTHSTAVQSAQAELWAAITNTDLSNFLQWGGYDNWQDAHPGTPGMWIYSRETTLDPRNTLWFQVGANSGNGFQVNIEDMSVNSMGLGFLRNSGLEEHRGVMQENGVRFVVGNFLGRIDEALSYGSLQVARMGAAINRLHHAGNATDSAYHTHNLADSNIADADMAREVMRLVRAEFRRNFATYVLFQQNAHQNIVTHLTGRTGNDSAILSHPRRQNNPLQRGSLVANE